MVHNESYMGIEESIIIPGRDRSVNLCFCSF
jgi:hypothetical protein